MPPNEVCTILSAIVRFASVFPCFKVVALGVWIYLAGHVVDGNWDRCYFVTTEAFMLAVPHISHLSKIATLRTDDGAVGELVR